MNRKNQSQGSTQRLLKSKYNDKQKIKTSFNPQVPLKKIMLSDLCAQQKLKVGQLIKINESRKLQITQLNEQLLAIRHKFAECQIRLNELLPQLEAKQLQCRQNTQKLRKNQMLISEKEKEIEGYFLQCKQFKQTVDKINRVEHENRGIQTQIPYLIDYAIQTKKLKKKSQEMQTDIFYIQQDQVEVKSKNNSKSMHKSARPQSKRQHSKNKYSFTKSQLQQKSAEQSVNYDEVNLSGQSRENVISQEVEQCFEDLTRKWMQLKQKNLNKLKNQYEQSKNMFYKEVGQNNFHLRQFKEEDQEKQQNQQLEQNEIDQNQLNKMLKSKNFSASRLLNSKGLMNQSQNNQRKGSFHQLENKIQVEKKKKHQKIAQIKPDFEISINQNAQNRNPNNTKAKPLEKFKSYEKEPMFPSYYENDLIDLVEQLDK